MQKCNPKNYVIKKKENVNRNFEFNIQFDDTIILKNQNFNL